MTSRTLLPLLASLFLVGCASETATDGSEVEGAAPLGQTQQAIVNGDAISAENSGIPMTGNWCSSSLLSNRWVLTAAHCVASYENHSFTSAGRTTLSYGSGRAVAVDSRNRVVVGFEADGRIGVARYLQDGRLDVSFSDNGIQTVDVATVSSESVRAIAIDASDRIVVLAQGYAPGDYKGESVLVRLLSDGRVDTSFAGDGVRVQHIAATSTDKPTSVKIDSRGRIVIGGTYTTASGSKIAISRFLPTGAIDTSFAGDGMYLLDVPNTESETVNGLAIDVSDRIVAAGTTGKQILTLRLRTDGARDTSFAGDGLLLNAPPSTDFQAGANDVAIDAWGRIVLAGSAMFGAPGSVYEARPMVARLQSDGDMDTTFSGDGFTSFEYKFGRFNADSVAIESSGRIVLGGNTREKTLAMARLEADGSRDQAFGFDGVAETRFDSSFESAGNAIALDRSGHAFVAGSVSTSTGIRTGVASFALEHLSVAAWSGLTATMGGQKVNASWVYRHPTLDVALVYLASPLTVGGNATSWQSAALWSDSVASLQGKTLHCAGYGNTDRYSTTGFGTLRSADLTVSSTSSTEYTTVPNGRDQIQAQGDSGSACWAKDAAGTWRITGVYSWLGFDANGEVADGHSVAAPAFSSWIRGIRGY